MALELASEGDTEEDEEVSRLVKVNVKKKRALGQGSNGKGKQRDLGNNDLHQQRDREPRLQITVVYQLTNFFFSVVFSTSPQ